MINALVISNIVLSTLIVLLLVIFIAFLVVAVKMSPGEDDFHVSGKGKTPKK